MLCGARKTHRPHCCSLCIEREPGACEQREVLAAISPVLEPETEVPGSDSEPESPPPPSLAFTSPAGFVIPLDLHTCYTPWPVFRDVTDGYGLSTTLV